MQSALPENLNSLFDLLSNSFWLVFLAYVIFVFLKALSERGLGAAVVSLVSPGVLLMFLSAILISLLSLAVIMVQPTTVAVVISAVSPNGMREDPLTPGVRWIIPFVEEVVIYPTRFQTYSLLHSIDDNSLFESNAIRARTSDNQEVFISVSIIYRIDESEAVALYRRWGSDYTDNLINPLLSSYIREDIARYEVSSLSSETRSEIENDLQERMGARFTEMGLELNEVLLRDITYSQAYIAAVENKQAEEENFARSLFEAERIRTIAQANADAIRFEGEAQATAFAGLAEVLDNSPELLTYFYINRIAPEIDVMLLPNNAPFVFPLPDLFADESGTPTPTPDVSQWLTPQATPTPDLTPTATPTATPATP